MMTDLPVLWTFRRCPYAMRARLAIRSSGVQVELREILLRQKPELFLATSPKATVPVLDTGNSVIEESRDIMLWALSQNDPDQWLDVSSDGMSLIDECDGPFKRSLDHTKYANRYPDLNHEEEREIAMAFLRSLNARLQHTSYLMGQKCSLSDVAIFPFVRQFANVDRDWFDAQGLSALSGWLDAFLVSEAFSVIMKKHQPWQPNQSIVTFPH